MSEGLILDVTPGNGVAFEKEFLEGLGHPVLVCHGPDIGKACPILKAGCDKFEAAHGIVFQLDLDRPMHRAILRRYIELARSDMPIRVVLQPGQEREHAALLSSVQVWTHRPTAGELDGFAAEVEAADRALG